MHRLGCLGSVVIPLLLHLAFAPSSILVSSSTAVDRGISLPFQFPPALHDQSPTDSGLWIHLRNTFVRCLFRLPTDHGGKGAVLQKSASTKQSVKPGALADLLARYGGDVVLRFNISSADEAKALAEASNILFLDIWEFRDDWVDIRLAKDVIPSLLGLLPRSMQHSHTPLVHDLAQAIYDSYPCSGSANSRTSPNQGDTAFVPVHRSSNAVENLFFRDYQPLSVIIPWMRLLASLYPTHVRMLSVGLSYEGRDIPALRLGLHPTNSQKPLGPRKTIIVSGGSHAREWISVSTVNYIAYSIITSYGKSSSITALLEKFDWVFVPTINPDGYVYTWDKDRLWRKNRQETTVGFCKGIDLDRSWDSSWDGETAKGNPCSESYPGEEAFQAIESSQLAGWVKNETENNNITVIGFVDLHSYSQRVLYPFSHSCSSSPPALENLKELALGLAKAIRVSSGEEYDVASACEAGVIVTPSPEGKSPKKQLLQPRIETGGGSALDWFAEKIRVRYAYQIKLRDTGSYGFLLPREHIIPTGKEALAAIEHFGAFIQKGAQVVAVTAENDFSDASPDGNMDTALLRNQAPPSALKEFAVFDPRNAWELKRRRRV